MAFEVQRFHVSGARFTRDPEEPKTLGGGAQVIRFGVAFTGERRKDNQSGEWTNYPVFLDCEAIQFEKGAKLVDLILDKGKKGAKLAYLEGTLKMDQWDDKESGKKRTAIKLKVTEIIFADAGAGSDGTEGRQQSRGNGRKSNGDDSGGYGGGSSDDPIPF